MEQRAIAKNGDGQARQKEMKKEGVPVCQSTITRKFPCVVSFSA
jgi:hypothetical protein